MLLNKIKDQQAAIGVIGLGYVGLPLVIEFCKAGFPVTGLDIDQKKIDLLSQGQSYIKHIPNESIRLMVQDGKFRGSTNFLLVKELDCILMCVPTPLKKNKEPGDISLPFVRKKNRLCDIYLLFSPGQKTRDEVFKWWASDVNNLKKDATTMIQQCKDLLKTSLGPGELKEACEDLENYYNSL